jgi:hypothetical protein
MVRELLMKAVLMEDMAHNILELMLGWPPKRNQRQQ